MDRSNFAFKKPGEEVIDITLAQVLDAARLAKSDRISLVCTPMPDRPAGICMLLTDHAIKEVGSYLYEVTGRIGDERTGEMLNISVNESARMIFQWMVEQNLTWRGGNFTYRGKRTLLFVIVGTELCRAIAPRLQDLNCVVNL